MQCKQLHLGKYSKNTGNQNSDLEGYSTTVQLFVNTIINNYKRPWLPVVSPPDEMGQTTSTQYVLFFVIRKGRP